MTCPVDPRRRCLPVTEWPSEDRRLWERAIEKSDLPFSAPRPGAHLRQASIDKYSEGYGRWLGFLLYEGVLDPAARPGARLSRERLGAYFRLMQSLGNRDATILGRLIELKCAINLMDPGPWSAMITHPNGEFIGRAVTMRKRDIVVHDPAVLYAWGIELMEGAGTQKHYAARRVRLRSGLMVSLLAVLGLRLRSLLALRLGSTLIREADGRWWIHLKPEHTKNKKPLDVPWPASLMPWLERYLAVERSQLLAGVASDELWIGAYGVPLGERGVGFQIWELSKEKFGATNAFHAHRFRHSIASAVPFLLPGNASAAAAILNIGSETVSSNYVRGSAVTSAHAFQAAVRGLRESAVLSKDCRRRRGD